MRTACGDGTGLEDVFNILRFRRRRGVVSFRKFVVLNVRPSCDANGLHIDEGETQPLRVEHR